MAERMLLALDWIEIGRRERVFQTERMQELMINIKDIGLIHPITVTATAASQRYRLVAGHHRLAAFRALQAEGHPGFDLIPATLIEAAEALKVELSENLYRADLSVLEKAEHLCNYLRSSTDTVSGALEALARQAGQSARTFYRYKAIGEGVLVGEALKQIDTEVLYSTSQLYYLAKQCPLRETQEAIAALLAVQAGLTVQDAHARLQREASLQVREKLVSLQVPLSFREHMAALSLQQRMNKRDFTAKFLSAALQAYEQGGFDLP